MAGDEAQHPRELRTGHGDDVTSQTLVSGAPSNSYRFAGEYRDAETGLYKIGERYYHPNLGRWTQKDPLMQAFSPREANGYTYAGADPVNLVDPSGMHMWDPTGAVSDAADWVGDQASSAIGSISYSSEEMLATGIAIAGGTAVCGVAGAAATAASGPAAPFVAAGATATCGALRYGTAAQAGFDLADDDNAVF